ncbi:MAG: hypothetical protein LW860_13620 [Xanthomonadaceae bacterium]|jgi:hypothetical protein|nr:hypothetical protein [Xanthomonadaceae bacterium]
MRFVGWASIAVIVAVAGGSLWFLQRAAGSHPLAADAKPPVCGALGAGPAGGVEVRMPGAASPLGDLLGAVPMCDVATPRGPVSVAVKSRAWFAAEAAAGEADTAAQARRWMDGVSGRATLVGAVPGPWRDGWVYQLPGDDRLHLVAEDNGVLLWFAGRVPEPDLVEAARRSAEALRASMG